MLRKHTHDLGVLNVQFGSMALQSMLAGGETWRARLQYRVRWQTWRHGTNSCRPFPSKYHTWPCKTGPGWTQRHQPMECHPSGIILSCSPAIASPLLQDFIPSWLLGLRCWWCWGRVWCPKAGRISAEKGFLCVTPSNDKAHWGAYGTKAATSVGYGYCLLP